MATDDDLLKLEKLTINQQTAKIPWLELQRFFAAGKVIYVADELDLVEVALQFSLDNSRQVQQWYADKKLYFVKDEQAKTWCEHNNLVWAVVIKPWILVQSLTNTE